MEPARPPSPQPPAGTVEAWALAFVLSDQLAVKLDPGAAPSLWECAAPPRRITAPGRPPELRVVPKAPRSLRRTELHVPRKRARLLHAFWHHELQAAELLCWAVLAYADAPRAFRRGLLGICRDELRHMRVYQALLAERGFAVGDFPVRDWFWSRVPRCETPLQFVALLGIGLEGGNLDHAARLAADFDAVGDPRAAAVQREIGEDEVGHVRFAAQWFAAWTGGLDFARWRDVLLPPITPALLRGRPLNRAARHRAGLPADFVDALARYEADPA